MLQPPWLEVRKGSWQDALDEFATSLDETRANREYGLRSSTVRTETDKTYTKQRMPPAAWASPDVAHVMSARDVERLRAGHPLVLDPSPALLSTSQMREVSRAACSSPHETSRRWHLPSPPLAPPRRCTQT